MTVSPPILQHCDKTLSSIRLQCSASSVNPAANFTIYVTSVLNTKEVIHQCDDGRKNCATSYQPKSGGFYNFTCSAVNILGHFVKHSSPLLLNVTGEMKLVSFIKNIR